MYNQRIVVHLFFVIITLSIISQLVNSVSIVCRSNDAGLCTNLHDEPPATSKVQDNAICVRTGGVIDLDNIFPQGECMSIGEFTKDISKLPHYCCKLNYIADDEEEWVTFMSYNDVSVIIEDDDTELRLTCYHDYLIGESSYCEKCLDADIDDFKVGHDCAPFDCNDNAYFCNEDCEDLTLTPGCVDFCEDKDHDGTCAPMKLRPTGEEILSARPTYREEYGAEAYKNKIKNWYSAQFSEHVGHYGRFVACAAPDCLEQANDMACCCCFEEGPDCQVSGPDLFPNIPTYIEPGAPIHHCGTKDSLYIGNPLFPEGSFVAENMLDDWIAEEKFFDNFDCDDTTILRSPFNIEEDSCDLIDNDCDNDVDECISEEYKCIYKSEFRGCHILDFDGDSYQNASFGCPLCTDCDDSDPEVNPAADDSDVDGKDDNCNGVVDEMADRDGDRIPDSLDRCPDQNREEAPIDHEGCWYFTGNDNIGDWS